MKSGKLLIGGLITFLVVSGIVGWVFFAGVDWSQLDWLSAEERADAKAAALAEWKRKQEVHSIVVLTLFSAELNGKRYDGLPLEARLEIAGAENLSHVCRRMPYVYEAILRTLTKHAPEVVEEGGKLNLASQDENIRAAINETFSKGAVRRVRLAPYIRTSQKPKSGNLCDIADRLLAESEVRPD